MTPEEYIAAVAKAKADAERAVIVKLPDLEQQAYQLIIDFLDANVDTVNGRLVPNERATRALNSFSDLYLGALTDLSDYKGAVGQYLKNLRDVDGLIRQFQATDQGLPLDRANLGAVQELVVSEIINRYTENGLNPGFVQPLRQVLFNNISAGTNKIQARQQLEDFIVSGKDSTGKLSQYLEQTAQQGADSYTGAINARIMQVFKVDTYIMSGSLIKTSSPQCRFAINELGGLIDRGDWPDVKAIAVKNGLIEGTTFDNLAFNKLHWGCRHEFTPAMLTNAQREAITATPTNT
jgi:hypothetical protein